MECADVEDGARGVPLRTFRNGCRSGSLLCQMSVPDQRIPYWFAGNSNCEFGGYASAGESSTRAGEKLLQRGLGVDHLPHQAVFLGLLGHQPEVAVRVG